MAINAGGSLNSVPAPHKQTLSTNYLDFTSGTNDWAQQYLPDLMEQEAEVFGPRTISGFLSQVGAEESMTSDQVVWSEQGRLHLSYKGKMTGSNTLLLQSDIDETNYVALGLDTDHGVRLNDTVIISNTNGVFKAVVTTITNNDELTLAPYDGVAIAALAVDKGTTCLVYGSEFGKGTGYYSNAAAATNLETRGANEPDFKSFSNKPIIMKDYYEVSGSDVSRIGWVEVSTEAGESGYLWYLKAEADTRARFVDQIEMAMLESEKGLDTTAANDVDVFVGSNGDAVGTEGLFAAIEARGNMTSGVTGVNAATDLAEFDAILAEFDKQGAIEEYMMFVNRATSLAIDDMLASMNSYGAGGTS